MKKLINKIVSVITLILLLTATLIMMVNASTAPPGYPAVNPPMITSGYIAVAPNTIGIGQNATVNLWVEPPPRVPTGYTNALVTRNYGFSGIQVTFIKPDGTNITFAPVDPSEVHAGITTPGLTEIGGAMYFYYAFNQAGNWTATFSYPGETFVQPGFPNDTIYYEPCTASAFHFTVQTQPVNAGIINGSPYSALPTSYWQSPVNSNNREWSVLDGDWLQSGYNELSTKYNPYSTGPTTAHIVWTKQQVLGGLVGGQWGSNSYFGGQTPIILDGNVYYNNVAGGTFTCLSLTTGQVLYQANGTFNDGWNIFPPYQVAAEANEGVIADYLVSYSLTSTSSLGASGGLTSAGSQAITSPSTTSWNFYDPMTGALVKTLTNACGNLEGVAFTDGNPIVYAAEAYGWNTTLPDEFAEESLIEWNFTAVTNNNWQTGVMWNVSIRQSNGMGVGDGRLTLTLADYPTAGVVVVKPTNAGQEMMGFSDSTGKYLWEVNTSWVDLSNEPGYGWGSPNGPIIEYDAVNSSLVAFNVLTGAEAWSTQVGTYPWGDIPSYYGVMTPDTLCLGRFDGNIYAVNMTNGNLEWTFSTGTTGETVEGAYIFGGSSFANNGNPGAGADGMIYMATQTNYRGEPKDRFTQLYCVNATSGQEIWQVDGAIAPGALANGYLLGVNDNDGLLYAFNKGLTATTVTATPGTGNLVTIQGTVTDQSPGQTCLGIPEKGTPAIADQYMTPWMNYLFMQDPEPTNATGVPVTVTITDPNHNIIANLQATSDINGVYAISWTPPSINGTYIFSTSFAGSNSYYPSNGETAFSVGQTTTSVPTAAPQTNIATSSELLTYIVVGVIAIIIAIAVVGAFIMRALSKRP